MKKIVVLVVLMLSICTGIALAGSNNHLLLGSWKSDRVLTTNYNRQIDKANKNMVNLVDSKTGHMVITFATNRMRSTGAAQDIQIDGMAEHRGARDFDVPYSIVSGDEHSMTISTRDESSGFTSQMVFNFDDYNTMWMRAGGDGMSLPDSRVRVYFKRAR